MEVWAPPSTRRGPTKAGPFVAHEIEKIIIVVEAEVAGAPSIQSVLNQHLRESDIRAARVAGSGIDILVENGERTVWVWGGDAMELLWLVGKAVDRLWWPMSCQPELFPWRSRAAP